MLGSTMCNHEVTSELVETLNRKPCTPTPVLGSLLNLCGRPPALTETPASRGTLFQGSHTPERRGKDGKGYKLASVDWDAPPHTNSPY